jgi:hypothetical protein
MKSENHKVTDPNAGGFAGSHLIKSLSGGRIEAIHANNEMVKVSTISGHYSISPRVKGAFR